MSLLSEPSASTKFKIIKHLFMKQILFFSLKSSFSQSNKLFEIFIKKQKKSKKNKQKLFQWRVLSK